MNSATAGDEVMRGGHEEGSFGVVLNVEDRAVADVESVQLLDGGEQAYPRMLSAIAQARRRIDLEVYSFSPSGIGARFITALGQAAARGVAVSILIDGWGSARRGRAVTAALRAGGCEAHVYHRLSALLLGRFGRNHRKILLIDDQVAFLGGINIGDENMGNATRSGWADLALEIRGPECLRLGAMIRRQPQEIPDSSLRIHVCGVGGGWRLRRRYLRAFADAQYSIQIAHGYFLPDRGVVRAITAAAVRGVRVRLLLAGRSDIPFARAAARSLYRPLLAAGVAIYEWNDSVLHAKLATVDGRRLLVGSFNLDPFSLANLEALVEVDEIGVAGQAQDWIREHIAQSRPMTTLVACSRLRRWLLDPLGRAAARLAEVIGRMIAGRACRHAATDYSVSAVPAGPGRRVAGIAGRQQRR